MDNHIFQLKNVLFRFKSFNASFLIESRGRRLIFLEILIGLVFGIFFIILTTGFILLWNEMWNREKRIKDRRNNEIKKILGKFQCDSIASATNSQLNEEWTESKDEEYENVEKIYSIKKRMDA